MNNIIKVRDVISSIPKSRHITFTSGEDVRTLFRNSFKSNLPVQSFSFCRHFTDGSRSLLDTDPNQIDLLFYKNLNAEIYHYRPQYEKFNRVFLSHFISHLQGKIKNRLEDHLTYINTHFNTQDIFYTVRNHEHYTDVFSLSTTGYQAETFTSIINAIDKIEYFVDEFYINADILIKRATEQTLISPWPFYNLPPSAYTQDNTPISNKPNLSPQETKISLLLIKGKTAKEIGIYFNLSYRTVEHYIDNIKQKYNTSKKSELIYLLCNER